MTCRLRSDPSKTDKGFTLVELLVAVSILLIIATGLLPVFSHVTRFNQINRFNATANAVASGVLEKIAAMAFDDIGTIHGNPPGNIPQNQIITVDDTDYNVETLITWIRAKSATDPFDTGYIDTAYKNIRVIVSAYDGYTGESHTYDRMYTISAREGEMELLDKGNIRAVVLDSNGRGIDSPAISIDISGPDNYSMITDYQGQVLFGELEPGTYRVEARIPEGMSVPEGETVENGKVVKYPVEVVKWVTSDVFFLMDKASNFSSLSLKFVDADTLEIIKPTGSLSLNWNYEDTLYENYIQRHITLNDYVGQGIPADFIGDLWPEGTYDLVFSGLRSDGLYYRDYTVKLPDQSYWNGDFSAAGESLELVVLAQATTRLILYQEDLYSEFLDHSFEQNSVMIRDKDGDGSVVLEMGNDWVPDYSIISHQNMSNPERAFDSNVTGSYARFTDDGHIDFETDVPILPKSLTLQLSSGNLPNQIRLYGIRANGESVELTRQSGFRSGANTFDINTSENFDSYRLYVYVEYIWIFPIASHIYDVQINYEGYAPSGTRYIRIPIGDLEMENKTRAPRFFATWDVETHEASDVKIYVSSSTQSTRPGDITFTRITSEEDIQSIIPPGRQISSSSYLWIKQELTTNDPSVTPTLNSFCIEYEEVMP